MDDGNAAEHKQNIPEILQRLLDIIDETLDFTEYSASVLHYSQAYQALSDSLAVSIVSDYREKRAKSGVLTLEQWRDTIIAAGKKPTSDDEKPA